MKASKEAARRFLIGRLGLGRRISGSGIGAVTQTLAALEVIQIDPVMILDRNHNLVLHNRVAGYQPVALENALKCRLVFDACCGIRCFTLMDEYPWFAPMMRLRRERDADRLAGIEGAVRDVAHDLEVNGPRTSRQIESDERVRGYWDRRPRTKVTSLALQIMWECGMVIATTRSGGEITFDLPERAIPACQREEGMRISLEEAREYLLTKYYRSFRLLDAGHICFGWQRLTAAQRSGLIRRDVGRGVLTPVEIDGVKRKYWCLTEDAAFLAACEKDEGRPNSVRLLSPLDNLIWRRERLDDLFGFSYKWEIYTPESKRIFGPYTLPILYGDRMVARIDLKLDRAESVLRVNLMAWEPGTRSRGRLWSGIGHELERLQRYLGAGRIETAGLREFDSPI